MDWVILVILVPAVVVPIVLLVGFCGCAEFGEEAPAPAPSLPSAPVNLHAVLATAGDGIVLSWVGTDSDTKEFVVERRRVGALTGESPAMFVKNVNIHVDTVVGGLLDGTSYEYTVMTRRHDMSLSGPSNSARCTIPPKAPINLAAKAADLDRIDLIWQKASERADGFRVLRRSTGGVFGEIGSTNQLVFSDKGLPEGTLREYQVIAFVNGWNDSVAAEVRSNPSAPASAVTLSWKTCYMAPLTPAVSLALPGSCLVQRIGAASLTQSGEFVRVTLRGLPTAIARLSAVTISKAVPAVQGQAWDSATPPLSLTFAGAMSVNLQNGDPVTSDKVRFGITAGSLPDLAIAMNVAANSQSLLAAALAGRNYFKAAALEATVQDRSAGYTTTANQVVCIEKIEVA